MEVLVFFDLKPAFMYKSLLLFLLLTRVALGQEQVKSVYHYSDTPFKIDSLTGGVIYTEVVSVDSATRDQLYNRAKMFLLKAFTNSTSVIQVDDKGNGMVGSKGQIVTDLSTGAILLTGQMQMKLEMAIEIRVKDGRYRYELSNIEMIQPSGYRSKIDEAYRRNPRWAAKQYSKPLSKREYEKYMSDKNPMMAVVRKLKIAMSNQANRKNDF